ncbi:MAG: DUF3500 domain-containing protein [Gemmatimonas sp.]|nr:DUF3500 domain-containing protein [Gemmatimonas sp.]
MMINDGRSELPSPCRRLPMNADATPSRNLLPFIALTLGLTWIAPVPLSAQADAEDDPFFGITTEGELVEGLFPIRATGVTTAPIVDAADAYLATLTPEQTAKTRFDLDSDEWRHWSNIPVNNLDRRGLPFREMTEEQREAALALVRSGLSARGFEQARDIMRIDGYLADFLDNHEGYGEDLYFIDIFGEPSTTEPWGWQLDGHHLVVNFFVLGDQIVMSPNFWGSEPVFVETGEYAGIEVLQEEQDRGLELMRALRPEQRRLATIETEKTRNSIRSAAFRDNLELEHQGIQADQLDADQQEQLLDVIGTYVGAMRDDHASVRMEEVRAHFDDTHFAWIGEVGEEALFYYRIQSPVILIEFDHTVPVSLREVEGDGPSRNHIHIFVRTPNGNDYGKDLLRQHYEQHAGDPSHQH